MKSVSGKVTSRKPVSLSKAAKFLSNFVSVDNGASRAVSVYLSRASESFNELVEFHKELKGSHSHRKHKKHRPVVGEEEKPTELKYPEQAEKDGVTNVEDGRKQKKYTPEIISDSKAIKIEQASQEVKEHRGKYLEDSGRCKNHWSESIIDEKIAKFEESPVAVGEDRRDSVKDSARNRDKQQKKIEGGDREAEVNLGIDDKKGKQNKKRKNEEIDDGELVDLGEQNGSRTKKKRKIVGDK